MVSSRPLCGRRQELRRCRSAALQKRAESRVSSRSPPPSNAHPSEVVACPRPFYPAVANKHNSRIDRATKHVFHGRKELKGFLELMIQQRYFRLLSMNSQIKSRWVRQLRGFCTPHVVIQGQCSHLLFLEQKWLCQFGHPCLSTTSWRVTWEKDTLWHCNFFDACFRKLKRPISKCNTYIFIPPLSFWQYAAAGNDVSENVPPLFLLLLDNLKLTESSP